MGKIVIDAREYSTSTGRYIFRLIQYLEKLESQHEFVVLIKPRDMGSYTPANPRFNKAACKYKEFTFGEQLGFKRQLDRLKPDLVHFGMTQQPVLYRGRAVTTIHDLTTLRFSNPAKNPATFKLKQLVYARVVKRVARKSAQVIVPSQFVAGDLVRYTGISPGKVTVTPEAANPIAEDAEPTRGLGNKRFIMYVGRPTPHKNLERLVEAFVILQNKYPELRLVLAGNRDANYQRIERRVKDQGVNNVAFTGYANDAQLRWLYEHCMAYVFPSLSEGFGLPGLEAMVHGAPVVSSNATCLPEVYGNAARYFDPFDVQAMAVAIDEVLSDKSLRESLIEKGRAQAAEYSWQRMAEQTLAVYEKALSGSTAY